MKLFLLVSALALSSACTHVPGVKTPATPAQIEQQVYSDLFTVQTALEGVKSESVKFPGLAEKVKPQVNAAIASYNAAEKAFTDYEAAKNANLKSPVDLLHIQAMIADLQRQIAALGKVFANSNQPQPVQKVN